MRTLVRGCAEDYECVVLVNSRDSRTRVERRDDALVVRAGTWGRPAMMPISPSFFGALRHARADLVHLHCPNPPGELGYLALQTRPRMVLSYHNPAVRPSWAVPMYRPWLARALRAADRIVVGDRRTMQGSADLELVRERCVVIPYGIDLKRFGPRADTIRQAQSVRAGAGSFVILFVGGLRYYKGLDVLLSALPLVEGDLIIVGDGSEEPRLRRRVAQLGLGDRVRFVGVVSDSVLPSYYHAADVLVLPSTHRSETFGIALAEAHACGVPTVSTELGTGTSSVNRDGETGLVIAPKSPLALATALTTLASDQELRTRLGRRARELAYQRFGAERMVAQTRQVYDEVLDAA
jgi:glycosyltransferase involved in cell wall biosynthesis